MPAMGDIRNRLCALATSPDRSIGAIRDLFEYRLSTRKSQAQLELELETLIAGDHSAVTRIRPAERLRLLGALRSGRKQLPRHFELADLSVGNLLLVGATSDEGSFVGATQWARDMLGVRAQVLPVTLASAHLAATLDTGEHRVGQASLTSEQSRLRWRIVELFLSKHENTHARRVRPKACPEVLEAISHADAVVFGFGSFYTSILPHLLVDGITESIQKQGAPSFFLCNPTVDKETGALSVLEMVRTLRRFAGDSAHVPGRIVYFAPQPALAIPIGDVDSLSALGCDVHVDKTTKTLDGIASAAADVVAASTGRGPSVRRGTITSETYPVVLFDLDHTLYDYSNLRRAAAVAALVHVCAHPSDIADFLLARLTPPVTDVLREMGFADLRRDWNAVSFYQLARGCETLPLREAFERLVDEIRLRVPKAQVPTSFDGRRRLRVLAKHLAKSEAGRRLRADVLEAGDASGELAWAKNEFDEYVRQSGRTVADMAETVTRLRDHGAAVCIVTEGESITQQSKLEKLRLIELVDSVAVTDRTLGVMPLLNELFELWADGEEVPEYATRVYDSLSPYTVKEPPFYTKLAHAIVSAGPSGVAKEIESARFVAHRDWARLDKPRIAMVGDSYSRDVEPLLLACRSGAVGLRVVAGKYAAEDPLHEVLSDRRPAPLGYFPNLDEAVNVLIGWILAPGEPVSWPHPQLPSRKHLDECSEDGRLSTVAQVVLGAVRESTLAI